MRSESVFSLELSDKMLSKQTSHGALGSTRFRWVECTDWRVYTKVLESPDLVLKIDKKLYWGKKNTLIEQ